MNGKIYCITNLVNGKYYIGQTIQSLTKRFSRHKFKAKQGTTQLSQSIRKYGPENFVIEVIMDGIYVQEELSKLEKLWIFITKSQNNSVGYNRHEGGNKPPIGPKKSGFKKGNKNRLGISHTEESIRKISLSQKGRIFSDETRLKMSEAQKGKSLPKFVCEKISNTMKGKKPWNIGKSNVFSENTLKKMRDSQQKRRQAEKENRL